MVTHGKAGIHSIAGKYVLNHCYSTLLYTVLQCPYFFFGLLLNLVLFNFHSQAFMYVFSY